jgi:hypothetical protein
LIRDRKSRLRFRACAVAASRVGLVDFCANIGSSELFPVLRVHIFRVTKADIAAAHNVVTIMKHSCWKTSEMKIPSLVVDAIVL